MLCLVENDGLKIRLIDGSERYVNRRIRINWPFCLVSTDEASVVE